MQEALIDTDILSYYFKGQKNVQNSFIRYLMNFVRKTIFYLSRKHPLIYLLIYMLNLKKLVKLLMTLIYLSPELP